MKKILKLSLVVVAALTVGNVQATSVDFLLTVEKEQGKTVTFALNQIKNIDLSIYDANEDLISSEKISSDGNFKRTYDLKALPEGVYFLKAESEMKIAKYQITVVGNIATLASIPTSEVYKPIFMRKNGKVSLSILNFDKSPVFIKIYDADDNEVYDSKELTDQNVVKHFDLNPNFSDKYTFVMKYDDKVFVNTIASK